MALGMFHFIFTENKIELTEVLDKNNQNDYFILFIFMASIFLGRYVYSKSLKRLKNMHKNEYIIQKKISEKNQLIFKMGNYRTVHITRLFFVIIPIILTPWIIETGPTYFLCLILGIIYSLAIVPSKKKVIRHMELKDTEIQRINNPTAIIARRTFSLGIGYGNIHNWKY